jgi:hypothetical protein
MIKQLEAVVNTYSDLNPVNCCSFLLTNKDGKTKSYLLAVCHSGLLHQPSKTWDTLYTSYYTDFESGLGLSTGPDLLTKFFKFLKYDLYHKWSDHFHLDQLPGSFHQYIKMDLTKIPAQVVLNICVASRFPLESFDLLRRWDYLCKKESIHPALAWVLSGANFSVGTRKFLNFDGFSSQEHLPFYPNQLDIRRLVEGDPVLSYTMTYFESPTCCTPTNAIWGRNSSLRALVGSNLSEFCNQIQGNFPNEVLLQSSR